MHPESLQRSWLAVPAVLSVLLAGLAFCNSPSASAGTIASAAAQPLRVCADPHNLPFSDIHLQGFENQVAKLVSARLQRPLQYVWLESADVAPRALVQNVCDLILAEPSPANGVNTTIPYYWSSYVLISRADRHIDIASLKDHRLHGLKIGVEALGPGQFFTPPARILLEDGAAASLIPFDISLQPTTGRTRLIEAVASGRVDVAAAWGPAVGELARRASVPLRLTVITDNSEFSARKQHFGLQAMQYQIAMAVRPGDRALRERLDRIIAQEQPSIERLLERFGVPLISPAHLGSDALARFDGARSQTDAAPMRASGQVARTHHAGA